MNHAPFAQFPLEAYAYGAVESLDPLRDVLCPGSFVGCATLEESVDELIDELSLESDGAAIVVSVDPAPLGLVLSPGAVPLGWRPLMPAVSAPVADVSLERAPVSLGAT